VAPIAEWIARAFWSTIRNPDAPIATRLTQNNKRTAKGSPCNCQIVPKDELKTLREQAELGRHVNRYQMRNEGYRTWRFDTASGKVCLLLTSDWDWKKPDVASQNCIYEKD
jgi:hypothetical protein